MSEATSTRRSLLDHKRAFHPGVAVTRDGAVVGVAAGLVGGEPALLRLSAVSGDVGVELVDREVVEHVVRREHDGDVLTGVDRDLVRIEGQRCGGHRSEEHTSELQSLMSISYAVF